MFLLISNNRKLKIFVAFIFTVLLLGLISFVGLSFIATPFMSLLEIKKPNLPRQPEAQTDKPNNSK
jgi:hypothetical protein